MELEHVAPASGQPTKRRTYQRGQGSGVVTQNAVISRETGAGGPGGGMPGDFNDHGGRKLTSVRVQLIFWGSTWATNPPPTPSATQIDAAVQTLMGSNYMALLSQYGVGFGSKAPSLIVSNSNPPNPFTDNDVAQFITGLLSADKLTEPDENNQMLYMVVMPVGTNSNGSFTGEHTFFSYQDEEAPFNRDNAAFAWITNNGTLDGVTTIFSHELVEACTDPEGSAILGDPGTCNQTGWCEIGDVCEGINGTISGVAVQSYWSQQDHMCRIPPDIHRLPWWKLAHWILAHEPTPEWLIALWLAIHGGDPAPLEVNELVTLSVLTALANTLQRTELSHGVQDYLLSRLKAELAQAERAGGQTALNAFPNEQTITDIAQRISQEVGALVKGVQAARE